MDGKQVRTYTSQIPGLSSLKAKARYPPAYNSAVSRRVGLSVFMTGMVPSHSRSIWARMTKSWPVVLEEEKC